MFASSLPIPFVILTIIVGCFFFYCRLLFENIFTVVYCFRIFLLSFTVFVKTLSSLPQHAFVIRKAKQIARHVSNHADHSAPDSCGLFFTWLGDMPYAFLNTRLK